jgi:glycosyltransferase involved in cell wall biosynthesis
MQRRRVLLSSFACSPLEGSEPGVGWRWLVEIARRHDVVLVTHAYYRDQLEPALAADPIAGLEVCYLGPPALGLHPHVQLNSRLFYTWWQLCLRRFVRQLMKTRRFDLVHHLTWGTFRFPCLLGGLGVPLVMGPLGGGEVAPWALFKGLPWRDWVYELARVVPLYWARFDPLAAQGPRASVLVFCRNDETRRALPPSVQARSIVAPEIGAPAMDDARRTNSVSENASFRLLFAGRLLGLKGVAHAVGALNCLVKAGHDVTLDIAGEGPLRPHLQREIARFGLAQRVRLLGRLPQEELFSLYLQSDLFLFPSLHDSSGSVVLESLSRGLPVVCLDLGGPKNYLTPECGVVVSTHRRSRAEVEQALAHAVADLIADPERLRGMSAEAFRHAGRQTWEAHVDRVYCLIEQRLKWATGPANT